MTDAYRVVPGQVWWTRLFPGDEGVWTALGAPFVFTEPRAADTWRAYFDRTLEKPTPEAYRAFLERGTSAEFWFEYIVDAYAGADDLVVFHRGVPDDPSSLPHAMPEAEEEEFNDLLEVKDRLRRRNLTLLERSATEQVSLGDLLCGWITVESDGTHRLEGATLHVPRWAASRFVETLRAIAQEVRQHWPRLS